MDDFFNKKISDMTVREYMQVVLGLNLDDYKVSHDLIIMNEIERFRYCDLSVPALGDMFRREYGLKDGEKKKWYAKY